MSLYRKFISLIEKTTSRFKIGVDIAFRMRKFANSVIGQSLYDGKDLKQTGEFGFLKVVAPHIKVFMEVGAHVGQWTNYLLSLAGKNVTGFLYEPSNHAMEKLKRKFEEDNRLILSSSAIGDRSGYTSFYEETNVGESSSIFEGVSVWSTEKVKVPIDTLEREFEKHKIDTVDMIKIDAEGYDGFVLKGAKKLIAEQRIGIFQFEYNFQWLNARTTLAETLNLLEDFGYTTYLLKRDGAYLYDYMKYNEFFYYANFIAVSPAKKEICNPFIVNGF
jgi:FkbM family methyltransferase